MSPVLSPDSRSAIDHAEDKETKDADTDQGDIETDCYGVYGPLSVEEEQRYHFTTVRQDSNGDLCSRTAVSKREPGIARTANRSHGERGE
jgi:hypothetical protein